jgi:hypothetical protein
VRALPRTLLRSVLVTVAAGLAAAPAAALSHRGSPDAASAASERPGGGRGELPKPPATSPTTEPTDGPRAHPGDGGSTGRPASTPPALVPPPAPPLGPGTGGGALRWWPYGNIVHGAFTVDSNEHAPVQLVVQRGTVSELSDTSVTVTSSDGVALTWATSSSTRVLPLGPRRGAAAGLGVGAVVGVWGPGTLDAPTARFVLVQRSPGSPGDGNGDGSTGKGHGSAGVGGQAPTSTEGATARR